MASKLRIKVDIDAEKTKIYLKRVKQRSENFTPVFIWARNELERSNAANFAGNGLPSGAAWNPLDPEYGAWKSKNFPGRPTLVRGGELFRSLTRMTGPPNVITPKYASFGTNVKYAEFHQTGTFKMPKRQIIFEPPLFARRLAQRMADHVVDGKL